MKSQDEGEFRAFVATHRVALVRTAYLVCGDRDEAEDLTQTALLKLHPAWNRAKSARNRDAYVRRILVNTHLSRIRRRRVAQILTDRLPDKAGPDSTAGLADRSVLMAALARLPARRRATVVLRYWEDLPEAEVAHILGCSVGAVRSQAFKGLAELRRDPELVELFRDRSTLSAHAVEARL
ncbi:SigE family RNA polymerase sigma factor [Yinghuangia seranimata]|uniref:SigE family RNA polymerase sigma factor n=1 Tax=Yinghuangia seranimata TaxID=408067 RepID=UPI00248C9120|nr:SigE family RNA polymerase sigma factor [Yinghuangia seranimata]MDI2131353.1 SigE family RNA polymerase sigma factor [Yinghuangia seranimata]